MAVTPSPTPEWVNLDNFNKTTNADIRYKEQNASKTTMTYDPAENPWVRFVSFRYVALRRVGSFLRLSLQP